MASPPAVPLANPFAVFESRALASLSREANVEGLCRSASRLSPALATLPLRGLSASGGGSPHCSEESFQ
jgi:hypothetical protein